MFRIELTTPRRNNELMARQQVAMIRPDSGNSAPCLRSLECHELGMIVEMGPQVESRLCVRLDQLDWNHLRFFSYGHSTE